MALSDEQRKKYADIVRNVELAELFGEEDTTQTVGNVMEIVATAVAEAARRDLIEGIIADVSSQKKRWNGSNPGSFASHDGTFDGAPDVLDARDIADAIRSYLPADSEQDAKEATT